MLGLHRLQETIAARSGATTNRTRARNFISGLALLTVCLITANPLPSVASQRTVEAKAVKTTTKLKASATKLHIGGHLTLTATVSSPKATGKMLFYLQDAPGKPFKYFGYLDVHAGVAKGTLTAGGAGTFEFRAVYQGNKSYESSLSNAVKVVVDK
jgi:hypothetical protein